MNAKTIIRVSQTIRGKFREFNETIVAREVHGDLADLIVYWLNGRRKYDDVMDSVCGPLAETDFSYYNVVGPQAETESSFHILAGVDLLAEEIARDHGPQPDRDCPLCQLSIVGCKHRPIGDRPGSVMPLRNANIQHSNDCTCIECVIEKAQKTHDRIAAMDHKVALARLDRLPDNNEIERPYEGQREEARTFEEADTGKCKQEYCACPDCTLLWYGANPPV